ncbi:MAG: chorismate mutase [Clostridia bacterium]|nr:chorismate mutase [Clostridia bacterium]
MDMKEIREKIDSLDDQIKAAFEERMALCADMAAYKKENDLPIFYPAREREIIARLTKDMDAGMATYTKVLYNTLFEVSRSYQTKRISSGGKLSALIREAAEQTDHDLPVTCTVACQGTEGANSQLAAEKLFSIPNIMFMGSFEGVFNAVAQGFCRYGILPISNNLHGSVTEVYDLMKKHKFYIVKSIKLRVDHVLVAKKDVKLENIKEIFSHPQAIGQCSAFLASLGKNVKVTECANTAIAAKMVADSDRGDIAAICNPSCGALYGLSTLQDGIADSDNNYTRFICISKKLEVYPGANKTSIMFTLPHSPGSLFSIIAKFAALGVNFSKIESRPIPGRDFEYMFYLDFDASLYAEGLLETLDLFDAEYEGGSFLGCYSEI